VPPLARAAVFDALALSSPIAGAIDPEWLGAEVHALHGVPAICAAIFWLPSADISLALCAVECAIGQEAGAPIVWACASGPPAPPNRAADIVAPFGNQLAD